MRMRGLLERRGWMVALGVVFMTALAIVARLTIASSEPLAEATALMRALAVPAFLAAGVLRLARWRITGERCSAVRGAAMILMGGLALPSMTIARTVSGPDASLTTSTFVRAVTSGLVLYVLAVALSSHRADRADLERKVGWLTVATAALTVLVLTMSDRVPPDPAVEVTLAHGVAVALSAAWLTVAAGALMKARVASWARPAGPLLAAMGVAELFRVPDRPATTLLAAALTATVGFAVAYSALVDLIRAAQDERTASQRLVRELARARDEVWTRDSWRQELTHDARSTLAGIRAAMQTLDRHADKLDPEDADRLRAATLAELAHLEHLLVRRHASTNGPEPVDFELTVAVRTVVDVRRGAGQQIDLRASPVYVRGVPGDVATILQNLLVNAQVHAPGARVSVEVRLASGSARLTVSDDGPGIPPGAAASVFDRGFRGRDSWGTGLGLSVARTLARQQGGELELGPTATGTTFVVTLPLAETTLSAPPMLAWIS